MGKILPGWIVTLVLCGSAFAQGPRELSLPDPDRWWFEIAPYLWGIALEAEAEIGSVDAEADADFGDILENLNMALMLHGEAHKGPWTIFGDVFYAGLENEDDIGPQGGGEIEIEVDQTILELGGGYGFGQKKAKFDVLFGGRALFLSNDVEITGAAGGDASADESMSHFGPLLGGRLRYNFTSRWFTSVRGDASGFGIDDAMTWNATGLVGYRFTELFSLAVGYRYMDIEIEEGNLDLELTYQGPLVGFGFTF